MRCNICTRLWNYSLKLNIYYRIHRRKTEWVWLSGGMNDYLDRINTSQAHPGHKYFTHPVLAFLFVVLIKHSFLLYIFVLRHLSSICCLQTTSRSHSFTHSLTLQTQAQTPGLPSVYSAYRSPNPSANTPNQRWATASYLYSPGENKERKQWVFLYTWPPCYLTCLNKIQYVLIWYLFTSLRENTELHNVLYCCI